jgi:hypothetical protein
LRPSFFFLENRASKSVSAVTVNMSCPSRSISSSDRPVIPDTNGMR